MKIKSIEYLNRKITRCKKCPRLASYIRNISKTKVRRFKNEKYWGKPLAGFGDINAEVLIVGLAPAAHGGNRTGRMFTGDSSGDWVAKVLYENGFATKPSSQKIDDGFLLSNTYITAAVRCAPPNNKPLKEEFANCSQFLQQEFQILTKIKIIICLGRIAFSSCCNLLQIKGEKFAHKKIIKKNELIIICSHHPSRQNTQTGRLSWIEWADVFSSKKKSKSLLVHLVKNFT